MHNRVRRLPLPVALLSVLLLPALPAQAEPVGNLRAVSAGLVTGTARPLHLGRNTQVWEIRIEDAAGHLVCIARLTLAVVPRKAASA